MLEIREGLRKAVFVKYSFSSHEYKEIQFANIQNSKIGVEHESELSFYTDNELADIGGHGK